MLSGLACIVRRYLLYILGLIRCVVVVESIFGFVYNVFFVRFDDFFYFGE